MGDGFACRDADPNINCDTKYMYMSDVVAFEHANGAFAR